MIVNFAVVEVEFAEPIYTVAESNSESVQICIRLLGSLRRAIFINVEFVDINTTSVDYSNTATTIVFQSGSPNPACFVFSANNDSVFENDEMLSIVLSTVDNGVNIPVNTALVTVTDSSMISVGFTSLSQTVEEGGSVPVCVGIFSGSLAEQVTLLLRVTPLEGQGNVVVVL